MKIKLTGYSIVDVPDKVFNATVDISKTILNLDSIEGTFVIEGYELINIAEGKPQSITQIMFGKPIKDLTPEELSKYRSIINKRKYQKKKEQKNGN